MRLNSFDYFRGIAILFIVAGHSYGSWRINSVVEKLLANLIAGGSTFFVFISGFLFHYVYYNNLCFKEFMIKKTKNVLVPYIVLSTLGIIFYITSSSELPYIDELVTSNISSWYEYVEIIAIYLWTGKTASAYWYIPFIFIVFLLSPLFVQYIKISEIARVTIFLSMLVMAMFIHRPFGNLSPLHSVLYFTPIYMLGIICSINRKKITNYIRGKAIILGVAIITLAILQTILYEGFGSLHKREVFYYDGVDIGILQKILMCFFFLSVLQKYENKNIPGLRLIASSSFAIYFIHPWILIILNKTRLFSFLDFIPGFFVFIITIPLVIIGSLLIAYLFKLLLKKNSRYVVGW